MISERGFGCFVLFYVEIMFMRKRGRVCLFVYCGNVNRMPKKMGFAFESCVVGLAKVWVKI